eukprot:2148832-Rhodomonas_salina.1
MVLVLTQQYGATRRAVLTQQYGATRIASARLYRSPLSSYRSVAAHTQGKKPEREKAQSQHYLNRDCGVCAYTVPALVLAACYVPALVLAACYGAPSLFCSALSATRSALLAVSILSGARPETVLHHRKRPEPVPIPKLYPTQNSTLSGPNCTRVPYAMPRCWVRVWCAPTRGTERVCGVLPTGAGDGTCALH